LEGPGSNPGGGKVFLTRPVPLWGHPASYTMGTGYFPGGKKARAWLFPPTYI